MTLNELWEFSILPIGDSNLTVGIIISLIVAITGIRIGLWIIRKFFLRTYFKRKKIDVGRSYAVTTFVEYIIYVVGALLCLDILGVEFAVLWGGAAALMVGIGLGLQQTFNDLTSGIILLTEGTVEVGDVVKVDNMVGTVKQIGLRTSKVETRDYISIIIPNSKLVMDNAVNYSHNTNPVRFSVPIGVAYGSDIYLVTDLILKAMQETEGILKAPIPEVIFKDFGNSSLDFNAHFYSNHYVGIELVKSRLRYKIMDLFKQHDIEIPFPQQDLWLRNPEAMKVEANTGLLD